MQISIYNKTDAFEMLTVPINIDQDAAMAAASKKFSCQFKGSSFFSFS
jgi:hypothetical protein